MNQTGKRQYKSVHHRILMMT